ncbi:MAG: HAD-IIB family hydrolase [Phycisphaerae bacterium]|nr:HAD-IIB family hydrolase [Phycisphaerae bacterium]
MNASATNPKNPRSGSITDARPPGNTEPGSCAEETAGSYIMLVSIHGLIRGTDLELGRDADTGGQTLYVVELARELIRHPNVDQVDLVTRLVADPRVDDSYAQEYEELAPGANIVRIRCGPDRYLHKESLWPHLGVFVDNLVQYLRSQGRAPDLIHGHYADAGYVVSQLSSMLDLPMAFTGHSLGRVKRRRLLDNGLKADTIERRYHITRRIEAEETALEYASFVVTSTHQEVEQQYALYDRYQPQRMMVIPPGVNLDRFSPPPRNWGGGPPILKALAPFLADPNKPLILAICRPDPRKNIETLLRAYGESKPLQDAANLAIVAGNRDDINDMDRGGRSVLLELLHLIDLYDLYGKVAYPKHHASEDVPDLYRIAVKRRGVFVNPALTEPFGLTLLEAAASGLPIVATADGGPKDIIEHCKNGRLVDPLNAGEIADALLQAVSDADQWRRWSQNGLRGARRHFSWEAHVKKYMKVAKTAITHDAKQRRFYRDKGRLITADRMLVTDIDNTLIGDKEGLRRLMQVVKDAGSRLGFGIATGRSIELTRKVLAEWSIPMPQLLITSVGSEIHYGPNLVEDRGWQTHISYRWRREALVEAMEDLEGIELQPPDGQRPFKVSYVVDEERGRDLSARDIVRHLRRKNLQAKVIYSHGAYIDLLPLRASKGLALCHFAMNWHIPLERILVAGDSGNDEEMLTSNTLGVVVGNYDKELETLRENPNVYFAQGHHAWGILEGIEHYDFLGEIRRPESKESNA